MTHKMGDVCYGRHPIHFWGSKLYQTIENTGAFGAECSVLSVSLRDVNLPQGNRWQNGSYGRSRVSRSRFMT